MLEPWLPGTQGGIAGGSVWRVKNNRGSLLRSFISRTHPHHQVFIVRNEEIPLGLLVVGRAKCFEICPELPCSCSVLSKEGQPSRETLP